MEAEDQNYFYEHMIWVSIIFKLYIIINLREELHIEKFSKLNSDNAKMNFVLNPI